MRSAWTGREPTALLRVESWGYEDEKFSYVIATRSAPVAVASRILRHPLHSAGKAELKLCTPTGLKTLIASKKHPDWEASAESVLG